VSRPAPGADTGVLVRSVPTRAAGPGHVGYGFCLPGGAITDPERDGEGRVLLKASRDRGGHGRLPEQEAGRRTAERAAGLSTAAAHVFKQMAVSGKFHRFACPRETSTHEPERGSQTGVVTPVSLGAAGRMPNWKPKWLPTVTVVQPHSDSWSLITPVQMAHPDSSSIAQPP